MLCVFCGLSGLVVCGSYIRVVLANGPVGYLGMGLRWVASLFAVRYFVFLLPLVVPEPRLCDAGRKMYQFVRVEGYISHQWHPL